MRKIQVLIIFVVFSSFFSCSFVFSGDSGFDCVLFFLLKSSFFVLAGL